MFAILKRILKGDAAERLTYVEARAVLERHEHEQELVLAARSDTKAEMLYYLAGNGDAATRRAVAGNPAAPAVANRLLADDVEGEVRLDLARKIGRLLPDLMSSERELIVSLTLETLERLAADQLPRVRAALAQEIKALACVPRLIIEKMARDAEESVYVPILEYSPLLSDNDLLEIIASARAQQALAVVARRRGLDESVSEAIVASLDIPSITALIANPSAKIRDKAMEQIVENARNIEPWHGPLVMRTDLSVRTLRRIAGFVSSALLQQLADRTGLDDETRNFLGSTLRERLEREGVEIPSDAEKAHNEAKEAADSGKLDAGFVEDALETGRRALVIESIALLAQAPRSQIERVFSSRNARALTALSWHAGLTMRVAFKIQTLLLRLPADQLLPARSGVAFPMTEEEMLWHLSYFGFAVRSFKAP